MCVSEATALPRWGQAGLQRSLWCHRENSLTLGFVLLDFSLGGLSAFIRDDILNLALKLDVIISVLGPLRVTPPLFLSVTRPIFPVRKCD